MTPVDATSTSSESMSRCPAASDAVSRASINPCSPTDVLAQPLLATTARAEPDATTSLQSVTDGETMLLRVKVPATVHRESDAKMPRSYLSSPGVLIPAKTPPALKPFAAVTPPSTSLNSLDLDMDFYRSAL